jgi:curved DNA-binding protein CbpA
MPGQRPVRDHYAVLGVQPSASNRQITTAYRGLIRALHPDTRPDRPAAASDEFTEVVAAYDVLRDPERRAAYDALRARRAGRSRPGQPGPVRVTRHPDASAGRPPADRLDAFGPLDYLMDLYRAPLRAGPTRVDPLLRQATPDSLGQILRWMWVADPWL